MPNVSLWHDIRLSSERGKRYCSNLIDDWTLEKGVEVRVTWHGITPDPRPIEFGAKFSVQNAKPLFLIQ